MTSAPLLSVQNQLQHILIPQWKAAGRKFTAQDGALGREGTWGESINLAHLVEKMGIEVKAQADVIHTTDTEGGSITQSVSQGPAQTVIWNDALNAWVTGTAENGPGGAHLVLDRRATETATDVSTYWLAYEEGKSMDEMKRVVWDMDANVWAQWDATTNSFFRENGYRKIWNPSSQSWSIEQ